MKIQALLKILIVSTLFPIAAHAYAGPGVAIGAIIVFFTVIFAFFASTFISVFKFIKKSIIFLKNKLFASKKISKKKVKS